MKNVTLVKLVLKILVNRIIFFIEKLQLFLIFFYVLPYLDANFDLPAACFTNKTSLNLVQQENNIKSN